MYITIEGPEATGKTTQAEILYNKFKEIFPDREVILTKEPGSKLDPVCQQVREILLKPENVVSDKTALLLFLADRAQHIESVISPTRDRGGIVISDRSSLSTVVYHVAKMLISEEPEKISHDYFYEMIDFAQEIQPDLCFIATADFNWCVDRLKERHGLDRIESFGEEFHRHIHKLFNEIAENNLPISNNYIFGIRERMSCFPKRVHLLPKTNKNSTDAIGAFISRKCVPLIGDR